MKKLMKRIFILFGTCIFILTGCSRTFNWDNTVDSLIKMRYDEVTVFETKEQLDLLNAASNDLIKYYGGRFEIKLTKAIYLVRNYRNDKGECRLYQFENKSQAQQFYYFYLEIRSDENDLKYGIEGNVVARTDSEYAMKVIGFDFK